jgi:glycosyltransferase involved in cell wall biosynthesis
MNNLSNIQQDVKIALSILMPITPDRWDVAKNGILNHFHIFRYGDRYVKNIAGLKIYVYTYPVDNTEVIIAEDNKEMTLGQKREILYQLARGEYSWQIDSDDDVHEDALEEILKAIYNDSPDCITFQELCRINGVTQHSNHSLMYDDWANDVDGYSFVRTPFYKDVILTRIARLVPFERIRYGEDHAWSRALKPFLVYETHIDKELYIYQHNSKPEEHDERYGIIH